MDDITKSGSTEAEDLAAIRLTDNSVKACDPAQPEQVAKPLELDEAGLPVGIYVGMVQHGDA